MKKLILLCCIFCAANTLGQINLVLNPSFEQYSQCQYRALNIKYADYWTPIQDTFFTATDTLGPGGCTPFYCNTCVSHYCQTSIPLSDKYYHYPRTGNGMVYNTFSFDNSFATISERGYLQGRLKHNLTAGTLYSASFYITLTQSSGYACNNFGAYLDDGTIDTTTLCGMPQTTHHPQVNDTAIYGDTINWKRIEGTFIANGTEKFITIGNFFDSAHTHTIPTNYWHRGEVFGTYLIDDVAVIPCDNVVFAGNDTMIHRGDSVWIGPHEQTLPYTWYKLGSTVAIDSGGGMWVKPDTSTTYILEQKLCGVTTYDTIKVYTTLGVASPGPSLRGVTCYPNPATNELTIVGAKGCEVIFYDVVGKAILHVFCNSDKEVIDISALLKEVYTMQVVDKATGEKVIRRVIKE